MPEYDVIIIGAGPVGMALAIELNQYNIKTAIFEKHENLQLLPKAQLLNPRTMEFFRRWQLNQKLISKRLLPKDFPYSIIWSNGLKASEYTEGNIGENITKELSPENYLRIPLWLTETVLREKLTTCLHVKLFKPYEFTSLKQQKDKVLVNFKNNNHTFNTTARYVVGCDGAKSKVRAAINIKMQTLSEKKQVLSAMFSAANLKEQITLPKALIYYNLYAEHPGMLGVVDYDHDLWYGQIINPGQDPLEPSAISKMLEQIAGFSFNKNIHHTSLWIMQVELAETFAKERVFLAGDACHTFNPTGGHGLNTGFGDALNLGWKLAEVIHGADAQLLKSYESERKSVAQRNLNIAKANTEDAIAIAQAQNKENSLTQNAQQHLAKQHTKSIGLAMGYCYQTYQDLDPPEVYHPRALPGYFAPHCMLDSKRCLYDALSNNYTLLSKTPLHTTELAHLKQKFLSPHAQLDLLELPNTPAINALYQKRYYLLRPDWHIIWCSDDKQT